jgi:quercetin dioxygenase-like cupin family protein
VFVVHSGDWRFDFGEHGDDARLFASAGDIVSFPTKAFRGFTNVGEGSGFLWSVLGGDDPGRVTWAPRVFELARDYGLVLMENGSLIDRAAGQAMPDGVAPMPPTGPEQVAALRVMTDADAAGLVVRLGEGQGQEIAPGAIATPVIGPDAPMNWPHGFRVRRIALSAGAALPAAPVDRPQVVFVQEGMLDVTLDGEAATLGAGDTITFPIGASLAIASAAGAVIFMVLGGDTE